MPRRKLWMALGLLLLAGWPAAGRAEDGPVVMHDDGDNIALSNGKVSFMVNKTNATIRTFTLGNSPNLAGRGAYFAVANSGGHDGWDIRNGDFKVLRRSPDIAEISVGAPVGGVYFTQYYVLRRGDPGFYVFVLMEHRPGDPPEGTGQIRWSFYLNSQLFNYHLVNDQVQNPIPNLTGAKTVQDATFRLADGTVYTKYNYVDYLENSHVYGLCGMGQGSYGVFIITPSTEFLQAPTKQEITVHAGPIIHRMLASGHFEPRELSSPSLPDGWRKLCGPWMVYATRGDSPKEIWADAKAQAANQIAQWPYSWMQHPDYPLARGDVTGTLKLFDAKQPAANALMVLTAPKPDWQLQVMNYIFSTRADASGRFTLPHVRPGTYTLFAAVPGQTDEFRQDNITVTADAKTDLGTIIFKPAAYSAKLWEIGYADLRTTGFRLSDQPRQYGLATQDPSDLTYTIGTSTPGHDWYYAQAKPGAWTVKFDLDHAYTGQGVLTVSVAGQTNDPELQVSVNGKIVGEYKGGNSSALYRSAILGSSYHENKIFRFPASLLREGPNTAVFRLTKGAVMYDVVKLEVDDSAAAVAAAGNTGGPA